MYFPARYGIFISGIEVLFMSVVVITDAKYRSLYGQCPPVMSYALPSPPQERLRAGAIPSWRRRRART